jgi:hypothetical protein
MPGVYIALLDLFGIGDQLHLLSEHQLRALSLRQPLPISLSKWILPRHHDLHLSDLHSALLAVRQHIGPQLFKLHHGVLPLPQRLPGSVPVYFLQRKRAVPELRVPLFDLQRLLDLSIMHQ